MTGTRLLVLAAALALSIKTPAEAQVPITECATLEAPGSYVLTGNLSATGNCLVAAADFITIDLGGFAITGDGNGAGITDNGVQRLGIVIRNGAVTIFPTGIDLGASLGSQVIRVRVNDNGTGILVGNGSTVAGNNATQNNNGIVVGNASTVTGNTASSNFVNGIFVGNGSTVTRNTATGNGGGFMPGTGIAVGSGSTVSGNTASSNSGNGVRVTCPSNVIGNATVNNTDTNLLLLDEGCNSVNNLAP